MTGDEAVDETADDAISGDLIPDDLGLARRIGAVLAIDPGAPAVEFEARWHTWREIAQTVDDVVAALDDLGAGDGAPVGILVRNRPASIGLLLGVLRARACAVIINPGLGAHRVEADLHRLDLAMIAGERADVDALVPAAIAQRVPVLSIGAQAGGARFSHPPTATVDASPGIAVRMLTSGTTGPPKRVDLSAATLEKVMRGAKHYESNPANEVRLRDGVVIVHVPLVHVAGVFRVLQAVLDGRRIALFERFTVNDWAECVRRHRPRTASLVPSALRMVLDADLDPRDLSSLRSVVSGTAPLAPELADVFTACYGVPVLTSYGATEFGGGVAGWNLADHEAFAVGKRGSVGRAHAGCTLRIVDAASGEVLSIGAEGLLEVQADQLGPQWVRTTDLGRLDDDGFLWILGRADETILRGGFKVQPEVVRVALERHEHVREAAVVGIDDERLGQVPVAAVEPIDKASLDPDEVLEHAAAFLARYEVPVEVRVVDALPRTVSDKVDLAAVRALFAR